MKTAAVLLAAGSGSRFKSSQHKLLADLKGRPVISHALASLMQAAFSDVLVVTGAVDLADELNKFDVKIIYNPDYGRGIASSITTAIKWARPRGFEALVFGLGDQPKIQPIAWKSIADARAPIAVASYDGKQRNPVRLSREVWPLLPTFGDEGARLLIRSRPELVEAVPFEGSPADIDTLEDLQRWN